VRRVIWHVLPLNIENGLLTIESGLPSIESGVPIIKSRPLIIGALQFRLEFVAGRIKTGVSSLELATLRRGNGGAGLGADAGSAETGGLSGRETSGSDGERREGLVGVGTGITELAPNGWERVISDGTHG
jgi:hypothetical protein